MWKDGIKNPAVATMSQVTHVPQGTMATYTVFPVPLSNMPTATRCSPTMMYILFYYIEEFNEKLSYHL